MGNYPDIVEDAPLVDRLRPVERDMVEHVASAVIYRVMQRVNNFAFSLVRELEKRGIKVDVQLRIDRTRRGALSLIQLEFKDVNPKLFLLHRGYLESTVSDRWARWIAVKTLVKAVESEIDRSIEELVDRDLYPAPDLESVEVVGRIPVQGDEKGSGGGGDKERAQEQG